jgi:hypothetical protein
VHCWVYCFPFCAPWNKNSNYELIPFVINTTGKIHKEGIAFLHKLADHAAETRNAVDPAPFFNYYLKILSSSLMNFIADTIRAKAIAQFSKSFKNHHANLRDGNREVYGEWLTRTSDRMLIRSD